MHDLPGEAKGSDPQPHPSLQELGSDPPRAAVQQHQRQPAVPAAARMHQPAMQQQQQEHLSTQQWPGQPCLHHLPRAVEAEQPTQGSRSRASSRCTSQTPCVTWEWAESASHPPREAEAEPLEAQAPACPQLQLTKGRAPPGGQPAEHLLHRRHPLRAASKIGRCRM